MLKHRETYEIMSAESVGWSANRLTLGKLSGRNAFKTKLAELGIELSGEEAINAAFARFKDLADRKREIFDEDLHALLSDGDAGHSSDSYKFISLKVATETGKPAGQYRVCRTRRGKTRRIRRLRPGGRGVQGH